MRILLLAIALLFQADPTSRSWNQAVEPFRIIGNVHYVGASDIASYLITTPKGHILIDGGFVETAPMIRANIERLGFRVRDVKILLASHAHYDHVGGLAELKRVTGATFYASEGDAPLLARGGHDDPMFGERFLFPPIEPDRLIHEGTRISLGGTTLTAHITPGHTKGCTTWTMKARDGGRTYDVVFVGSPSIPSEYKLVNNNRYANVVEDYRRQFALLRSLPCDVPLASHGNFFDLQDKIKRLGRKPNPFIDPASYRALIDTFERRLDKMLAEQRG